MTDLAALEAAWDRAHKEAHELRIERDNRYDEAIGLAKACINDELSELDARIDAAYTAEQAAFRQLTEARTAANLQQSSRVGVAPDPDLMAALRASVEAKG